MNAPLLQIDQVNKHFGGVAALTDVSLSIQPGEIYGLIGPNGAGKTTFFNVMTGLYTPDSGASSWTGASTGRPACTRWPKPASRARSRISACSMP